MAISEEKLVKRRKSYSGIYSISSPSGKEYIGSAVNFRKRWAMHSFDLRNNRHANQILQKAYNKYGADKIIFKKLIICEPKDLLFYEQLLIDKLKPQYNIAKIAGSSLGIKRTQETKDKLSKAKKGIPLSEDAKLAIWIAVNKPEAKAKNSAIQKQIHGTLEARLANSERQKIAQMRPEVRAKKGRALICVEKQIKFTNGHSAAEWCRDQGLTTNLNAFVAINSAVRSGKPIYGFHWKEIPKEI